MTNCYKCDKCGRVFDNYEEAYEHEGKHFEPRTWYTDEDMKVIRANMEYSPELWAPSAVVVPMERTVRDADGVWQTETHYVKYYYSAKRPAEQVFPIDESKLD